MKDVIRTHLIQELSAPGAAGNDSHESPVDPRVWDSFWAFFACVYLNIPKSLVLRSAIEDRLVGR
jgi:hypothetical protein